MLVRSIAVSALVVGALALNGGLAAQASDASTGAVRVAAAVATPVPLITMDTYSPSDYVVQAEQLEPELVVALDEGPGITGTEYLAQADAAANAAATVESLESYGVTVLGSSLDGTELTINVTNAAGAKLVSEVGATAVIGAPAKVTIDESKLELIDSVYNGSAIFFDTAAGQSRCSVGFNGYSIATGALQFATAGHCIQYTNRPTSLSGNYVAVNQSAPQYPTPNTFTGGRYVGKPVSGANKLGKGYDVGLVAQNYPGSSWSVAPYSITAFGEPPSASPVIDQIAATVGATACHSGATTGWTCGAITAVNKSVKVAGISGGINSIVMKGCMLGGDSGGPGLIGNCAIGIASWSGFGTSCAQDGSKVSGFFPLDSTKSSAPSAKKLLGAKWEPAISVSSPTIAAPAAAASVPYNSTISGTLSNGNVRHSVAVTIDSSTTPLVAKVAANGTWSVKLTGVLPGAHTASVRGTWGKWSKSSASTRSFTVTAPALYATRTSATAPRDSVATAQTAFPTSSPVVYLSTGNDALETLSTLFAAQDDGAPMLYIKRDSLPAVVGAELRRLAPGKIIVGGDSGVVSDAVLRELRDYAPSVTRLTEAQLDATVTVAPVTIAAPVQGTASSVSTIQVAQVAGVEAIELVGATSIIQTSPLNGWQTRFSWALVR